VAGTRAQIGGRARNASKQSLCVGWHAARRRQAPRVGLRFWLCSGPRSGGTFVRGVLYHEALRDGHGLGDLPFDHPVAWRAVIRTRQRTSRRHFRVRASAPVSACRCGVRAAQARLHPPRDSLPCPCRHRYFSFEELYVDRLEATSLSCRSDVECALDECITKLGPQFRDKHSARTPNMPFGSPSSRGSKCNVYHSTFRRREDFST
jgi:hypothetical protein